MRDFLAGNCVLFDENAFFFFFAHLKLNFTDRKRNWARIIFLYRSIEEEDSNLFSDQHFLPLYKFESRIQNGKNASE